MHESLARDRLYVTVDILILTVRDSRLRLLLGRRADPPFAGRWALPGRFVGLDETAETAVRRLIGEMLTPEETFLEQLYTFTGVDRDPRGRVISTAYLVILPWRRLEAALAREGARLRSFELRLDGGRLALTDGGEALDVESLAFDHGRIIETGLLRLRGKLDYTDIGFRFLNDPEAFLLGELQEVFEAVLDRRIDTSNFRRTILTRYETAGRIEQTDQSNRRGRGRPAALYRFNEQY